MRITFFAIILSLFFFTEGVNAQVDMSALADQLVGLTVNEVNELAKLLQEQYGIEPMVTTVTAIPTTTTEGTNTITEQTEFDVIILSPGGAKLNVVKTVKSITGLGLKESKAIVDNAPAAVKENIPKDEAEAIKTQLEGAGAEVEIK